MVYYASDMQGLMTDPVCGHEKMIQGLWKNSQPNPSSQILYAPMKIIIGTRTKILLLFELANTYFCIKPI